MSEIPSWVGKKERVLYRLKIVVLFYLLSFLKICFFEKTGTLCFMTWKKADSGFRQRST